MRKAAKALITFSTWPGDEAESAHVAQLVLLRLLRLQREAHRSAAVRNFEATVLLTRAATETCIAGMYWLGCDDATTRLGGANAKSVARMMQFLSRTDPLLPAAVDDLVRLIAEPLDLPKPWNMADAVTRRTDQPLATELYQNVYVPLSTLFEHPGGLTLLRHVGSAGQPKERPARFWSRRASLHTIDLRTAQLALVIAEHLGLSDQPFRGYAQAHMERAAHPMTTYAARGAISRVKVSQIPRAWRAIAALRKSFLSGEYATASDDERKSRARQALDEALPPLSDDPDGETRTRMIDRFAELIAAKREPDA